MPQIIKEGQLSVLSACMSVCQSACLSANTINWKLLIASTSDQVQYQSSLISVLQIKRSTT